MSFQRQIVNNFLKVGLLKYSGLVVTFAGSALVSRQLDPEEYGVQAIGAIYFGVVTLFLDAGFSLAVIREVDTPAFQRSVRLFALGMGALLGSLLILAAYPIAWWYGMPEITWVLVLYGVCAFLNAIPIVHEAILSRREQFGYIARVALLATVVQVIATYLLARAGFSYYALILPLLAVPLLKYAFYHGKVDLIARGRPWRQLPFRASFRRIRSLMVNLSVFQVLLYVSSNIDNLYLSKLYSTANLGLYNRAYNFNRLPLTIVSGVISTIQLPMFERIRQEGQNVKYEFTQYIHLLGGIAFPAVVIFHLFPYEISAFIWGEDWRQVGAYLYPLSILLPTSLMISAAGNLFIVFRGERFLVYNTAISSLAQIVGASIGVYYSIEGMIVGIILGNLFGSLPVTMYFGFYRLFGYTLWEIFRVWWFNYLMVIGLLSCYISGNAEATYAVLAVYSAGSLYSIGRYVKHNYFG
ncbi:O-antigen/teichoic acid export membrane protein [Neolewinella xylanilytica]|uniref:O-antigen/teichoic acid export membrane protein n=1 Tax=Neolewinella xylanilytica TaxID=1514080 RepID=A0A2S6I922_9BACT|nr:oligosaccharide flippase family protein [Neolewinella xylanilytica]PPK87991.1 O-antigen/teichoic acid export membrane protein [Neolewinella xylanilytica]